MIVNPSVPAKTVPDFIACAKANPRKVNMASGGTGTSSHIAGELFKMMTGIDMLHVPYRGGAPALTDLMGGQVQVYFGPITASFEAVFNQSSIFAGIMDLQGRLREVNNLAVDWCGYCLKLCAPGRKRYRNVVPATRPCAQARRLAQGGRPRDQ
jgi:hypothetical protein